MILPADTSIRCERIVQTVGGFLSKPKHEEASLLREIYRIFSQGKMEITFKDADLRKRYLAMTHRLEEWNNKTRKATLA
jgi:hypothetical protein